MARQHIISVTLRGLLSTQPRVISRDSASAAAHSDPSSMHRTLDAVDELAIWGAGRTGTESAVHLTARACKLLCTHLILLEPGGYLPGDLVRWCRRAHLRASVSASRVRSLGLVTDATRAKASTSGGDGGLGAPEIEGALDFDAVELQRALSTALVEVVPASLGHPWEVTPSTRSSASGSGGVWSALAGYENVKTELRRMLAWPEQHSDAWYTSTLELPSRPLATPAPVLSEINADSLHAWRGTGLHLHCRGQKEFCCTGRLVAAKLCWRVALLQRSLHSMSSKCEAQRCFHRWWVRRRQRCEMWLREYALAATWPLLMRGRLLGLHLSMDVV